MRYLLKRLKQQRFWLLALSAALSAVYFALVWRADDTGQFGMSLLFFACAIAGLQGKWQNLALRCDWLSLTAALLLIGWVVVSSTTHPGDYTIRLFPFASALAVGLLASGWRCLKQYWRELTIFFFLGVPSFLAYHFVDISELTARFSTLTLWYMGFDITANGTYMALADGRTVQVVYDCSGIDMVNYLLGMSIICLIMFPISGWLTQIAVPVAGAAIGFLVNGVRVSLMVVLAKFSQSAFNNWHTGTGSYIFALLGVVLLGFFYWILISRNDASRLVLERTDAD